MNLRGNQNPGKNQVDPYIKEKNLNQGIQEPILRMEQNQLLFSKIINFVEIKL